MRICAFGWMFVLIGVAGAQTSLETVPHFALSDGPLVIRQGVQPTHPFTVTGATGAVVGLQNGEVELWEFPTKVFSKLRLEAEVDGYSVPIDLNEATAAIEVQPDHTTITYSHAAITVRQHMFVPVGDTNAATGAVIFFEIDAIRAATVTISLEPSMQRQWPAPQYGRPSASWVTMGGGGAYVLNTDNPWIYGMVGMPGATAGVMSQYQERPRNLPLEFKVRYEPGRDKGRYYPLMAEVSMGGERSSAAAVAAMEERLAAKTRALPAAYAATRAYYEHFFDTRLTVHTPDARLDAAMRWAEIAIEQSKVRTGDETGLTAGWYPSFDSARPGFGWYFGRDTLWTLFAVNGYGDRELARQALEFLARRQRADGKMMHEFSLTAGSLQGDMSWEKLGYEYAAADATPLFVMAVADYVRATGDVDFLRAHWEGVKRAYAFERAHDSDGDGVYDNSEGTGWVEAWPPKMPHQEIYLALLDESSSREIAGLARLMGESGLEAKARAAAEVIAGRVKEYRSGDGAYAFSKNPGGTFDGTATVFPAVGLWGAKSELPDSEAMLRTWASHRFSTDWGVRAVAEGERVYDPISYHQGSVWPLFTGWATMAEYRGGRPMAGYAALMRNVELTWAQDPGYVTEVLSGRFYQPLGRSSSHQLWSSAMVLAPAVRGMFGVDVDAMSRVMWAEPKLPASWEFAELKNVRVADDLYDVSLKRERGKLMITATSAKATVLCLNVAAEVGCKEPAKVAHRAALPLPAIEVGLPEPGLPQPGSETQQPRIIDETYEHNGVKLTVEGRAGSVAELEIRVNAAGARAVVEGGERVGDKVRVTLPVGEGWVLQQVHLSW